MGNTLTLKKNGANLVAGRKSLRVNDKNMKGRHLLYVTKTIHLLMIFFWVLFTEYECVTQWMADTTKNSRKGDYFYIR